ncbi:MAG: endonuclease MutS2 [Caldimicrobium sp.]
MKDYLLLDWEELKAQLINFLNTESAKEYLSTYTPQIDASKAKLLQEKSRYLWDKIEKGESFQIPSLFSLKKIIFQAEKRSFFTEKELFALCQWLKTAFNLGSILEDSPFDNFKLYSEMFKSVYLKILDILDLERAEIKDEASLELYLIRQEKKKLTEELLDKLEKLKEKFYKSGYLQDNIFLQKEGRYVLPVKPEFKSKVKGIFHGYSQSGATIFIEPIGIVELTNELEELAWREEKAIQKILKEISEAIFPLRKKLLDLELAIVDLDISLAKVKLGRIYRGIFPEIVSGGSIFIKDGFHPLLYFKALEEGTNFPVSNEFCFKKALLITGPNFGGKTVSLKTIGLLIFMGLNGFLIPAKAAQIPLCHKILVDLGDEQNILEGESSFSSHLKNLKRFLEEVDEDVLVLLDEPGRGTNFEEGSALVLGCIEKFLERGAKVVVTTHSPLLKAYALEDSRFEIAMVKNYKLIYGSLGESQALELAQKIGFNEEIIERAKKYLKEKSFYDYYERYLEEARKLEVLRKELELKVEELEKKRKELEEFKKNLTKSYAEKLEAIQKDWYTQFNRFLEEIKEVKATKAQKAFTKFIEDKFNHFFEKGDVFHEGDKVYIENLKKKGIIYKIKEKTAEVLVGPIKIELPLYQIQKIENFSSKGDFKKANFKAHNFESYGNLKLSMEKINLIGESVDNALNLVEKKLNTCFLQGIRKLLIVHGHGSGKLRTAIREYLKDHPLVSAFQEAPIEEGGSGATLVYLYEKN